MPSLKSIILRSLLLLLACASGGSLWAVNVVANLYVVEPGGDPVLVADRLGEPGIVVTVTPGVTKSFIAATKQFTLTKVVNSTETWTISVSAPGHLTVQQQIDVAASFSTVIELPILEVVAPPPASEGGAAVPSGVKIRGKDGNFPQRLTSAVNVALTTLASDNHPGGATTLPASVAVPVAAGPAVATPFQVTAIDDALPDGGVDVALTATAATGATMGTYPTGVTAVITAQTVQGGTAALTTTALDNDIVGIPLAHGVPGNWQGPDWWSPAPAGRPVIDDPRWNGSLILSHDDGTSAAPVSVRSKYETGVLFIQCQIKAAPVINGSHFYLGLSAPGGADPEAFLIDVAMTATTDLAASTSGRTVTLSSRAATGTITTLSQTWTTDRVAVWTSIAGQTWTVALRIPIDATNVAGLNLGSDPALWYQVTQQLPVGLPTTYVWPQGHPGDNRYSGTGIYPKTLNWGRFHFSTGPGDMTATATGLTLETIDLGIKPHPTYAPNPLATNLILHKIGAATDADRPDNFFYVKVRNTAATAALTNNKLKARFRIANWGSQVSDWIAAPWDDVPGGSAVPCTIDIPGLGQAGENDHTFNWKLTDPQAQQYDDVNKHRHQCVMVELSGPGLVFLRSSVYRNMTTAPASVFTQSAEISVKGLPALGTQTRDVYLWVQTANMPARVTAVPTPSEPQPVPDPKSRERDGEQPTATGASSGAGPIGPAAPPTAPKPTYIVRVYHDTGLTVPGADGTPRKLLEPQTAFGYEMVHEGALTGWRHKLEGAELIAPDFYRIAIANGGVARVVSTIEAVEPDWKWVWWLLGIVLLVLLLILVLRRR